MTTDDYATSFMNTGLNKVKGFSVNHPDLLAYFIYAGICSELQVFSTQGFKGIIEKQYYEHPIVLFKNKTIRDSGLSKRNILTMIPLNAIST